MKLSKEVKNKIMEVLDSSKEFISTLYEGLDEKTRKELGRF